MERFRNHRHPPWWLRGVPLHSRNQFWENIKTIQNNNDILGIIALRIKYASPISAVESLMKEPLPAPRTTSRPFMNELNCFQNMLKVYQHELGKGFLFDSFGTRQLVAAARCPSLLLCWRRLPHKMIHINLMMNRNRSGHKIRALCSPAHH